MRVPWTARRSKESILKEINTAYSLERLMQKLQHLGCLIRADSLGKNLDSGKDWGEEEKGATEDEMVRWHRRLNGHEFEQTLGEGEGQGSPVCWSMGMQRVRYDLTTEQRSCLQLPSLWLNWSPRFDLYISWPVTGIRHFSRELWFVFMRDGIQRAKLGH